MSDGLKLALAAGDPAGYEQAYDHYGPALLRTALRLLGSAADAEDAVQEVFVGLVRSRHRLLGVGDLKCYLFVALRHAAWRIGRDRSRRATAALDETAASAKPERGGDAEWLWQAAGRLPSEQKEVLAMRIHGELTFEQIAEVLKISPNTAASRYRYALQKLQEMARRQQR